LDRNGAPEVWIAGRGAFPSDQQAARQPEGGENSRGVPLIGAAQNAQVVQFDRRSVLVSCRFKVVLAQIIPLGYGTNDVIKAYNQAIPGLAQQRAAAGKHIVLVDMYTGFNASSMLGSDSIHPNTAGYKFMADHWYAVIGSLLPK
jgi:lysophospholipase L1-like esterase